MLSMSKSALSTFLNLKSTQSQRFYDALKRQPLKLLKKFNSVIARVLNSYLFYCFVYLLILFL